MSDDASPPSRPPHQPHDKLFKSAFSDLETAAAFLKTQLPARVAAGLDWSSLTIEEGSFIDGQLLFFYIYACGDFDNEAFANKVRAVSSPEIRTTAMTFAQRLHQEGRQEGHHEGRQEGRREGFREGRQEGQIQAGQQGILEVLEIRFQHVPPGLREEIEAIDDTARLSQLHRAAIRCADLEAFSREL